MSSLHQLLRDMPKSAKQSSGAALPVMTEALPVEASPVDLETLLEEHKQWADSRGEKGKRLELHRANFAGRDLTGVNLRGAILNQAEFAGADLLLADLGEAQLTQANFRGANLLGTDFRGAQLQGANFDGSSGLAARHLAEANLRSAILPRPLEQFEALEAARETARDVKWLLISVAAACVLSWLRIRLTYDAQLLRNLPAVPIPYLGDFLPIVAFYLAFPGVLVILYLFFQISLQRLRQRLADLPDVLPDGRSPDKKGPWLLLGILCIRDDGQSAETTEVSLLDKIVPAVVVYLMVPATLLLFWGRYLIMQELRSSALHIFLIVVVVGLAAFSPRGSRRGVKPEAVKQANGSLLRQIGTRGAAAAAASGIVLSLLTLGVIYGAPHATRTPDEAALIQVRHWGADALALVGYNPYPNLTESSMSVRPDAWTGRDDDLSSVRGAFLNQARLRHAEGYRSFWVNAHLWEADLDGARLSESDLRGANLRQSNLRRAVLDRAALFRAKLHGAEMEEANLSRADLREADLSFAHLPGGILMDAKLGGANLFSALLSGAQMTHADLQQSDLRQADLQNADLAMADLRNAYLWSARLADAKLPDASLEGAILIEADLRRADLRGATFQATVLRAADLTGANLEGADMRGALGLTPSQVCSAGERRGVQLDEALAQLVDARCGIIR